MNSKNRWQNDLPALLIIIGVIVGLVPVFSYGSTSSQERMFSASELNETGAHAIRRRAKSTHEQSRLKRKKALKKISLKRRMKKRRIASRKLKNRHRTGIDKSRASKRLSKSKKRIKKQKIALKKSIRRVKRTLRNDRKMKKTIRKLARVKKKTKNKTFNVTLGMWKFAHHSTKLKYAMALRESLIKIQKEMLKKRPRDFALSEPENPFVALINGLFKEAMAAQVGDRCLYAGWPSTYQEHPGFGRPYCVPSNGSGVGIGPGEEPFRTWNGEQKCSPGQILCNPAIFGMGSHSNGYCTNRGRRAFRNCQDQYYSDRGFPARAIVNQLIENPQMGYQNISEMQTFIDEYCGRSQGYQCRSIRERLARLEQDFPQEARAIVAAPAPEVVIAAASTMNAETDDPVAETCTGDDCADGPDTTLAVPDNAELAVAADACVDNDCQNPGALPMAETCEGAECETSAVDPDHTAGLGLTDALAPNADRFPNAQAFDFADAQPPSPAQYDDQVGVAGEACTGDDCVDGPDTTLAAPANDEITVAADDCVDNDCQNPGALPMTAGDEDTDALAADGEFTPTGAVIPVQTETEEDPDASLRRGPEALATALSQDEARFPASRHLCHGRNQVVSDDGGTTRYFPQGVGSCIACSLDLQINELNPNPENVKRVSNRYLDLVSVIAKTCYPEGRSRSPLVANEIAQNLGYCAEETYSFNSMSAESIIHHQIIVNNVISSGGIDSSFEHLYGINKGQFQDTFCNGQNGLRSNRSEILGRLRALAPSQGVPGNNGQVFPDGNTTGLLNSCLEEANERMNTRPQHCSLQAGNEANTDPTDFYNNDMLEHMGSEFYPTVIQSDPMGGCSTVTDSIPIPTEEERAEMRENDQTYFSHAGFDHSGDPAMFYYSLAGRNGEGLYMRSELYRLGRSSFVYNRNRINREIEQAREQLIPLRQELAARRATAGDNPTQGERSTLAGLQADLERAEAALQELLVRKQSSDSEVPSWSEPGEYMSSGDGFLVTCERPTRILAVAPTYGDQTEQGDPDASLIGITEQ
jgi:hypothetical protein